MVTERRKIGRNKQQKDECVREKGCKHLFKPFLEAVRDWKTGDKLQRVGTVIPFGRQ